eukprot:TRINITY_DN50417_c0_g1_i1.p1 TRINITY_DN50417_c0_g1~~TRINITY_DN50417_c0_g1_i1.p1  ORF type:complete len:75 (-),score=13.51 TRINITY_DN50417_c0_g1_i1:130-354(-)
MPAFKWVTPEVVPLFFFIGVGCLLPALYGFRLFNNHNDVVINRSKGLQFESKDSNKIMDRKTVLKYRQGLIDKN